MVKPLVPEAEETAGLLNELILKSQELLKDHPLNLKRMAEGKDPANSIWPWSPVIVRRWNVCPIHFRK